MIINSISDQSIKSNRITLVTALYDLAKMENKDKTKRKTLEEYYIYAEKLLKFDVDFIIFVENDDILNKLREIRDKYVLGDKTKYIIKPFKDLKYNKYLYHINKNDTNNPIKDMCPNKDTSNYKILGWSKFEFIQEAMNRNFFNTDFFGWIDIGCSYVYTYPHNVEQILQSRSNKIKFGCFNNFYYYGIDKSTYYDKRVSPISGGFFTGNRDNFNKFIIEFEKELNDVVCNKHRAPLEDQIIPKVIIKNIEIFNCIIVYRYSDVLIRWNL